MSESYRCLVLENTVLHYILISTQKQAVRNLYSLLLYGFLVPQPHVPT